VPDLAPDPLAAPAPGPEAGPWHEPAPVPVPDLAPDPLAAPAPARGPRPELAISSDSAAGPQPGAEPSPGRSFAGNPGPARGLFGPDFLLVALLNLAIGLYFGTMSVGVSAFAVGHGLPAAAAPITGAASLAGLLSGWFYGLRRHRMPVQRQLVATAAYMTAASLLLPLAPSVFWLAAAVMVTEAAVPPTLVLLNVLTERSVAPAVLTQAFTWNNSTSAAGSALSAWLAGRTADAHGASAAFALAPAAGLVLLTLAAGTARRRQKASAD
jgi:MFS family permease